MIIPKLKQVLLAAVALSLLFSATSCEPELVVDVTNNTNQELAIYLSVGSSPDREYGVGKVLPGSRIVNRDISQPIVALDSFKITAKNNENELVYSRSFTRREWLRASQEIVINQSDLSPKVSPLITQNT